MLKRILIAVPTNVGIHPETFQSIYNLHMPDNCKVDFQFFYGYRIDQIRNLIADYASRNKYDYVLFVDHDMIFESDTLQKLMKANVQVAGGLYIQRIEDTHNIEAYKQTGRITAEDIGRWITLHGSEEAMPVQAVGFGCTLVSLAILESVGYPQFEYVPALNHSHTQSEDIDFCIKVSNVRGSVVLVPSVRCGHIGKQIFTVQIPETNIVQKVADQDLLPQEMVNILDKLPDDIHVIYDIGACVGHWSRHAKARWPKSNIIMFDASHAVVPIMEKSGNVWWCGVLTDEDKREVSFYEDSSNLGGNSYYKETTGAYDNIIPRTEIGWTLETVIKHYHWPMPDLVKIDVQGAELDVLKGGMHIIEHSKYVIIEAQHKDGQYNVGGSGFATMHEFMLNHGFLLVQMIHKTDVDADYLYARSI